MTAQDIIHFWFKELSPEQHFKKDEALDQIIKDRFESLYAAAAQGELYSWRGSAHGRLAEIIVLDQFPRNMFRGHKKSFATDPMALVLCQEAIGLGVEGKLSHTERPFLLMPLMHSESKVIHEYAVKKFNQPGLENAYDFELKHKKIVDRFGRYPHRNLILGRESTAAEVEFLKKEGSSF